MTIVSKFLANRTMPDTPINHGFFSRCYANTATTVILHNHSLHDAFVKVLTGIVMNKYFAKHYNKSYMLAFKHTSTGNYFLMTKLDTNVKYINDEYLERYYHAHELGTLYKAVFYPYAYPFKQENINDIWLDAKTDNCGYYKGELILFDAIPSVDDSKISWAILEKLLVEYNIPYDMG